MKAMDVVSIETGEIVAVVTTRYNSMETLFENVSRWMRRHKEYTYVASEELAVLGLKWSADTYYVKEV